MSGDNIEVAIRVRPLIEREIKSSMRVLWQVDGNTIRSDDPTDLRSNEVYTFDHIFGMNSTNKQLHHKIIEPLVQACADGYNCTIFTYGQTSSGKTHTMDGSSTDPGIIPHVIERLFQIINGRMSFKYLIRVAYVEIYNERIYDLLNSHNQEVKIREDIHGNIAILAKETVTSTKDQVMELMKVGKKNRKIHSTNMNIKSSRSHAIFRIIVECSEEKLDGSQSSIRVSHFNLVDLAGSERVAQTKATGQRLIEGGHINKSLSTLAFVISQLADQSKFINYRDSKLTLMLKNALGGNAKTLIIANITPASLEDTHSTLSFAKRAKTIKNQPTINTITSSLSIIRQCQQQILRLQNELKNISEQNRDLVTDNTETKKTVKVLLQERIKLISKAFVSPESVVLPYRRRHTIGGAKSLGGDEFHNIITRGWEDLSTPMIPFENRLLQVVRANAAQTTGDSCSRQGALPFEARGMNLSTSIGDDGLETVPEEDSEEEFSLADYTVDDMDLVDDDDPSQFEMATTSVAASIIRSPHRIMSPFTLKPGDMSFEALEFAQLEDIVTANFNPEELRKEIKNLTSKFNVLNVAYTQQASLNQVVEEQNRSLLDDIAELTRKYNMESNHRQELEDRLIDLQKRMTSAQTDSSQSSSISQKYENLLKEVDMKDEDYFKLLHEKNTLEKRFKEMSAQLEKTAKVKTSPKMEKPIHIAQESNEDIQALAAQVRELNFRLVDQEEIMNQLTNKHKRREEELLRRLEEKEGSRGKLLSEIMKTERQVQVSPETEDDTSQTETIEVPTADNTAQTEIVEVSEVKIEEQLPKVEIKEEYCQTDEKLIVSTFDISIQAVDIDIEAMEERHEGDIIQLQDNILSLLTTEQSEEQLAQEQQVLICILQYAKETLELCSNKYLCLQELRENISTEESLREACEKFANLIHLDMQNARLLANRAPRSAKLLNHLLTEINQYRVIKEAGYNDIPAQLAEQISALRVDLSRVQSKLYTEQIAKSAARNDYNKAKAEITLLKETLHRVIPATTEKQILKDISSNVSDIDKVTHENVLLNTQLDDFKQKLTEIEEINSKLTTKMKNMENELADKTNQYEEQLKKRENVEIELIKIKSDQIDTGLKNNSLKIMQKHELSPGAKPIEGVSIYFEEDDLQDLPPPTYHDKESLMQIWRENNQLKVQISDVCQTVQKQCLQMAEYDTRIAHLKRASEEKDRLCEQESLHVRVTTKITLAEMEAKMELMSQELTKLRTANEKLINALETAKNDITKLKDTSADLEDASIAIQTLQSDLETARANLERTENLLLEACEDLSVRNREIKAYQLNYKHNRDDSFSRVTNELVELSLRYQTEHEEIEVLKKQQHQDYFYRDYYKSKYEELKDVLSNSDIVDFGPTLSKSKSLSNLYDKPRKPRGLATASSVDDMGVSVENIPLQEIVADLRQLQYILTRPCLSPNVRSSEQNTKLLDEKNTEIMNLKTENKCLYEKLTEIADDVQNVEQLVEFAKMSEEKCTTLDNELKILRDENVELSHKVEVLSEQLGYVSANLDSYVEQHDKLTKQKTDLLAGNARYTDTIKMLQENITTLEVKLAHASSEDARCNSSGCKTLEEKLQQQQTTYELLVTEYQKLLATNEKQLMKNYEIEEKLESIQKLLLEREALIASLRKNIEMQTAQIAKVESDKQSLNNKLKQIDITLQDKYKLELALQDQLITVKTLNEEVTERYETAKSHCGAHTEENMQLRIAVQELQQLKKDLEQRFEDMRMMNMTLTEQYKILKASSCREEYEALKNMYTEEMKSIRENCIAHLEQNRSLTLRVNQLELIAYTANETAAKNNPAELHVMLQKKEAEIARVKLELCEVESKLNDTTKELRRIRSRCVCEGRSPTSTALDSRRMKKNAIQDSQRNIPCSNCSEKVRKLEGKICNIEAQQLTAPSEGDAVQYYKCQSEVQKEKIEELIKTNNCLTSKLSKLEKCLDTLAKEKEALQAKASASSSGGASANLQKECDKLRAQLEELNTKYERVKSIARLRAKAAEKK